MTTENPFAGREYGNLVFHVRGDRLFYIGRLSPRQRKEWLRDFPGRWQTREDALRDLHARSGIDVEAEPPKARSTTSGNEVRTSGETDGPLPLPGEDKRHPDKLATNTALLTTANAEATAAAEIIIGEPRFINERRVAVMLDNGQRQRDMGRLILRTRATVSTDARVTGGDPGLGEPSRECPTAAQLVELLQTAYPINWEQLLRKRLSALGVAKPADLTPAKLAEFRDDVFWSVKQTGIKDPAALISHQAQVVPKAPAPKLRCPMQVEDTAGQSKSLERGPAALENSPAIASATSGLPSVPRTAFYGTTKAEVLSRAKAAIEAGEIPRVIAESLACAQEDFHASQREIGRAIGQSASWVNRLLQWRQSGYNQRSPFGPTTRAGRAEHRNHGNNHTGRCGGAEQPGNDGSVRLVGRFSPAHQTASLTPLNEIPLSASAKTQVLSGGEADGIEEEAAQVESDGHQSEKQKLSARNAKIRRKLSPERMRIVIEALKEYPILSVAAAKAGIHRKTLEYWLKCSEAGQDGYDIEWEGFQWRFHEACEAAIEEPYQTLLDAMVDLDMGPITYKVDQDLVDLGMEGADAYARDENGDFIEEAHAPGNVKMLELLLRMLRPERWARPRKRRSFRSGGVLVIGEGTRRSEKNCTASIKARQWKSA